MLHLWNIYLHFGMDLMANVYGIFQDMEHMGFAGKFSVHTLFVELEVGIKYQVKGEDIWSVVSFFFNHFHPLNIGNDRLRRAYFSNGWFNHQLDTYDFI